MEKLKQFENEVDQEIKRISGLLEGYRGIKLALNNAVFKEGMALIEYDEDGPLRAGRIPDDYRRNAPWTHKVRYVLNACGRGMTEKEIVRAVEINDGTLTNKKKMSLERAIRGMGLPDKRDLRYYNYKNSDVRIYVLYSWVLPDRTDVEEARRPGPEVVNDIDATLLTSENIEWPDK